MNKTALTIKPISRERGFYAFFKNEKMEIKAETSKVFDRMARYLIKNLNVSVEGARRILDSQDGPGLAIICIVSIYLGFSLKEYLDINLSARKFIQLSLRSAKKPKAVQVAKPIRKSTHETHRTTTGSASQKRTAKTQPVKTGTKRHSPSTRSATGKASRNHRDAATASKQTK